MMPKIISDANKDPTTNSTHAIPAHRILPPSTTSSYRIIQHPPQPCCSHTIVNMIIIPKAMAAAASAVTATTTAAALFVATAASFALIDANPSLWLYDRLLANHTQSFQGKRIWITGASSGIGRELAEQLAACDAHLILSGRDLSRLSDVQRSCIEIRQCANGDPAQRHEMMEDGTRADFDDSNSVSILPVEMDCEQDEMERIVQQLGDLDLVILNAGIGQQQPAAAAERATTDALFRINTLAPIHWTQALIAASSKNEDSSRKQRQRIPPPHICVTSSVAGKFAVPLSASYAASKHAVQGYFHSLASERPDLTISLPCPGPVATPLYKASKGEKMSPSRCARLILSTVAMHGSSQHRQQRRQLAKSDDDDDEASAMNQRPVPSYSYAGGETWIAQQPTLVFLYFHQLMPGLANWILRRFAGPTRVALWEAGLDLYDPASIGKLRQMQRQSGEDGRCED